MLAKGPRGTEQVSQAGKKQTNDQDSGQTRAQIPRASTQKSVGPDAKTPETPSTNQKSENGPEPIAEDRAPSKPVPSPGHTIEPQYLGTELVVESRQASGKY